MRVLWPEMNEYHALTAELRRDYMEYPSVVGLETLSACNARCGFCSYRTRQDKGTRASMKVLLAVRDGLSTLPADRTVAVNLAGTNEPLLDAAIFDSYRLLMAAHAGVEGLLYTNASMLSAARLDELVSIERWRRISVSLNAIGPDDYRRTMGLDWERTTDALDRLHLLLGTAVSAEVVITRVSDAAAADQAFVQYCRERWPRCRVKVRPRGGPLGSRSGGSAASEGCSQWFKIHFLPDGREKLCCVDTGGLVVPALNVQTTPLLEIYNSSWRTRLRSVVTRREAAYPCAACEYRV
jgi:MoaA/NifB/PqqE/SkfB family radical SAM enzyme